MTSSLVGIPLNRRYNGIWEMPIVCTWWEGFAQDWQQAVESPRPGILYPEK